LNTNIHVVAPFILYSIVDTAQYVTWRFTLPVIAYAIRHKTSTVWVWVSDASISRNRFRYDKIL